MIDVYAQKYDHVYWTSQKFIHTFLFMFYLYFLLFSTLLINTEDIKTMKEHIWNHAVNKNVLNKPECFIIYIL